MTAEVLTLVAIALALLVLLLLITWLTVKVWRGQRTERARKERQLDSVYNAQLRRRRGE